MIKVKVLKSFLLSFLIIFAYNLPSFSYNLSKKEEIDIFTKENQDNIYKIEKIPFENESFLSFQIEQKKEINQEYPNFWALSIFVPGLGQIFMGEVIIGVQFLIGTPFIFILSCLLIAVITHSNSDFSDFFVVPMLALRPTSLFYIWNIVDALFIYQIKKLKKTSIHDSELVKVNFFTYNF